MLSYEELENKYGMTKYKGKEYALTENATFSGVQNLRIDDSIFVLNDNNYSAKCIDKEGNEYIAYFVVKNNDSEIEDCCDWEEASYITKV